MYLSTIANLFLVISLIIIVSYLYVKINKRKLNGTYGLEILTTMPLSQKEKLVLVKAGDEQILLGVTPQQISFLTKVNEAKSFSEEMEKTDNQSMQRI